MNLQEDKYKKIPFEIPEDYLRDFPDKLMNKIGEETNNRTFKLNFGTLKPYISIAAVFAILLIAWQIIISFAITSPQVSPPTALNDTTHGLDQTVVAEYLSTQSAIDLVLNDELLTQTSTQQIDETYLELNSSDEIVFSNIEQDDIIAYLNAEQVDIEYFIDDLELLSNVEF